MGNPQGLIQMGFELFRAGTVFLQRVCTSVTQINSSNSVCVCNTHTHTHTPGIGKFRDPEDFVSV